MAQIYKRRKIYFDCTKILLLKLDHRNNLCAISDFTVLLLRVRNFLKYNLKRTRNIKNDHKKGTVFFLILSSQLNSLMQNIIYLMKISFFFK